MNLSSTLLFALLAVSASAAELTEIQRLIEAKRVPEALPLLENARDREPDNVEVLLLLGRSQSETQQGAKALETLEKALKLAPKRPDVLSAYGLTCLGEAGNQSSLSLAKKGRDSLEKAVLLEPGNLTARRALFSYYLNAPWIAGGSADKARQQAEEINRIDPHVGLMLLVAIRNKDKKFEESLALCDEALKRNSDDYFALYELGRTVSLSKTRLADGIAALDKCLAQAAPENGAPHSMVHFRLGLIFAAKGDRETARSHYEEGLKLDPSNKQISRALAELPGA